jgi:hypothetical protein
MATIKRLRSLKQIALTATFSTLFVLACQAQDPPMRVADLNYLNGNVSMQPAGADEWAPAAINRPFTTGDYLWADADSRAELHLNNATMRVGSQTSLGFLNLDDRIVQLRLAQGELILRARRMNEDDSFEIDTPNAAITILREGEYTLVSDPDNNNTWVVVRHGQAEITGGGQAFTLQAGNSAQLSGTDQLAIDVQYAPQPDDLEAWSEDRDSRAARSQSARYLPPDVIGYEDLDNYGVWRETPDYGAVWYPRVDTGWAPYHDGHWAWVEPWGWTWVDDAPWGFAPSHYGRWAYVNGGWGWLPGPVAVVGGGRPMMRAVYAPALVAFIGGGGFGVSLSIGGPSVGWVPLGPGEVYAPAYQVSQNYFRTVNVSNTTVVNNVNITNVYNNVYVNKTVNNVAVNQRFANMAAPNAVTAMPQQAFASGRPVRQGGISVPRNQIAQLQPASVTVAPPVAPVRQALAPTAGTRPTVQPPARAISMPVVAKVTPPPPPVSFAAKQAVLQQNLGRPLNMQAVRQVAPPRAVASAPVVRVAPPARQVTPPVRTTQPAMPMRTPNPQGTPAANRPPAVAPPSPSTPRPPENYTRPVQPPAQPVPQGTPRPQENNPRPVQPPQPQPRPQENNPRPVQPPPSQPVPQGTPRPQETYPRPVQLPPSQPRPAETYPRPNQPAPRPPQAAPNSPPPRPKPENNPKPKKDEKKTEEKPH